MDNQLPPPLASFMQYLSNHDGDGHTIQHIRERYPQGDPGDLVWINDLRKEEPWILFTKDVMTKRNPAEWAALKESGLTVFYLVKRFNHMNSWELSWRLLKLWPVILERAEKRLTGHIYHVYENRVEK
ncbi:MAG TPA: hypothetical protein ENH10_05005 [Bacteroidetes bacterium]|nr:hypothetical protein [Bacteroidota bacterium]HEX04500.1 hypothetical protein [Bacteroidota bacterium]